MNRRVKAMLEDRSSDSLFLLFREYLKDTIENDLRTIYKEKAELLDREEPWVFQLKK